jgi:hypothetical protein
MLTAGDVDDVTLVNERARLSCDHIVEVIAGASRPRPSEPPREPTSNLPAADWQTKQPDSDPRLECARATPLEALRKDLDDTLFAEKGSLSRLIGQPLKPFCRVFVARCGRVCSVSTRQDAPRAVTVRRAYRRCVRNVSVCLRTDNNKVPLCSHFIEAL